MELITVSNWCQIASYLEVKDLLVLSKVCRHLWSIIRSNRLWQCICLRDYGNVLIIMDLLKQAKIPFTHNYPNDYFTYYLTKMKMWKPYEYSLPSHEILDSLREQYELARHHLIEFSHNPSNELKLQQAIDILLEILELYPLYADVYALCALVCLQLGQLDVAHELMIMYSEFGYEDYSELAGEIDRLRNTLGNENRMLLIDDGDLSVSFKSILCRLFEKFDHDQDGVWSPREFQNYIKTTNDSTPALSTVLQVMKQLSCTDQGYLLPEGFCEFYFQQTLQDPEETYRDLVRHGFGEGHVLDISSYLDELHIKL
jgi:tetratricopeptide (TPR) repeat protein